MRGLALFGFLLLAPRVICAQENASPVVETLSSTQTCRGISISSNPATSVIISTNTLYRYVSVQNNDASLNFWCGDNSNVSVSSNTASTGMKVVPGATVFFAIVPGKNWWCRNDSATSFLWASVCRGR